MGIMLSLRMSCANKKKVFSMMKVEVFFQWVKKMEIEYIYLIDFKVNGDF